MIIKRLFDLIVSGGVILLTAPLMGLVALLIYLEDRGPVLYPQKRVGKGLREYEVYKFRSMTVNEVPVHEMGQVSEAHPMVTRIGRFIRRFKIDELPQLFNVFKSDMSLVGPRPTVMEQVRQYDDYQKKRLNMRPGMTGWAQVNGNVRLSWEERIALDVWYVDNWTPTLDFVILFRTVGVILRGEHPNPAALEEALKHEVRARGSG